MKILINTAHQRFGGAVQVALSFIHEARSFEGIEFVVWVGPGLKKSISEQDFGSNFTFRYFDFGALSLSKSFVVNRTLQRQEQVDKPDVIISTTGPTYFHSNAPQVIGFNLPLYIYPESPFVKNIKGFKRLKFELRKKLHYYFFKRDASVFVTQTNDVNERVRKALNTDKVITVTNTASSYYNNPISVPKRLSKKEDGFFRFITISSYYAHKDLELIPKIISELKRRKINNVEFVLTLKDEDFKNHIQSMDGIINVGPVRPSECPALYQECDAMFLPTLAECFSASYPEAMKMKKPIVTTDLGFARSICEKAALYFEPGNPESAVENILKLISEPSIQAKLIHEGTTQLNVFDSPQERAEKYIAICSDLAFPKKVNS